MLRRFYLVTVLIAGLCLFGQALFADDAATRPTAPTQPAAQPTMLAQIVLLTMQGDQLVADVHWKPEGKMTSIKLLDLPGDTTILNMPGGPKGDFFRITNAQRKGQSMEQFVIEITPEKTTISRTIYPAINAGVGINSEHMILTFAKEGFTLTRMKFGGLATQSDIPEATWPAFVEKHPDEIEQDIRPFLESLYLETLLESHDFWSYQVLADRLKPSPELDARVKQLLEQFNDPAAEKRDETSNKLKAMGTPAYAVLVRLDRKQLTPEQADRVSSFDRGGFLDDQQVTAFKTDKKFLLNCLLSQDQAVRQAAAAQLQTVLGQAIDFDAAGSALKRVEQLHKLRERILPTTRPDN